MSAENELYDALISITGAGMAKSASSYKDEESDDKEDSGKKSKKSKKDDEGEEKEASLSLNSIIDHPVFLEGFERRLTELRDEHGFLGN